MRLIDTKVTLPKGYFVADSGNETGANVKGIAKIIGKLEKANLVLSAKAIIALSTLPKDEFDAISVSIRNNTKAVKGQFLRSVFASTSDVALEAMTRQDYLDQMWMYFNTYGIGRFPAELWEVDEHRMVEIANATKKKDVADLNNTFRILDVKTEKEFSDAVKTVVAMPIVFGAQQEEMITEAFKNDLLDIDGVNLKVKENIFVILGITGKEFFKEHNILNTATDVLRYAYFVSGTDFKELPSGEKFKLKTSDKKVIMASLNRIAKRDIKNTFGDMKPYKSQWLAVSKNLFPGSAKFAKFDKAQGVFDFLRNGGKVETFNTITQALILDGDYGALVTHLAQKPGELLRSLDMIIRKGSKTELAVLVNELEGITLNPKLVIQVKKWLEYRTEHSFSERVFKVKGKPVTVDNKPLDELKTKRTMRVVEALNEAIIAHLKGKTLFPAVEVEVVVVATGLTA